MQADVSMAFLTFHTANDHLQSLLFPPHDDGFLACGGSVRFRKV